MTSRSNRLGNLLVVLIFLLLSLLIYRETLDDPFHFDDGHVVANRTSAELQAQCHSLNRLIPHLTFWLNHALNGHEVTGYHLVNILIHWLTAALLYYFLGQWLGALGVTPPVLKWVRVTPPFFAALFFLVHPLATQSVAYICQRYTSIATLFYVMSIGFYLHARKYYLSNQRFAAFPHLFYYLLALSAAIGAMLSKELAVTLPIMVGLIEFTLNRQTFSSTGRRLGYLLPFLLAGLIVPAMHLQLSLSVNSITDGIRTTALSDSGILPDWGVSGITRSQYFISQLPIIVWIYLKLLVVPMGQSIDHAFTIHKSFGHADVLSACLIVLLLFITAVFCYRKHPLVAVGICWFFVTLLPTSSIITNSEFVAEQRVYLPLIGGAIVVAGLLATWSGPSGYVITSIILTGLGVLAYQRNTVWASDITLWRDAAAKAPQKARPFFVLGDACERAGRIDEAIVNYRRSLENNPDYALALNNLGGLYISLYQDAAAVLLLEKAVRIDPGYAEAQYNLGLAYNKLNQFAKAETASRRALELRGNHYPEARFNLAMVAESLGREDDARRDYLEVLKQQPGAYLAHYRLGRLAALREDYDEAAHRFIATFTINSQFVNAYYDLGKILVLYPDHQQAADIYRRYLLYIVIPDLEIHKSLGQYFIAGKFLDEAIGEYQKVIQLDPRNQEPREQLIRLYLQVKNYPKAKEAIRQAEELGFTVPDEIRQQAN